MINFSLKPRWDIFCKIVDNFGDIGVCWRLAKQLRVEHGLQIRLWIDDLSVAQSIIQQLDLSKNQQVCQEITISKWFHNANFNEAAEVVIEAFACELPAAYLAAMTQKKSKWINLEYLSAESWVDDFHGKPSPQANGLTRYFYFPGFTEKTGGLLRESNISNRHSDASRHDNRGLNISLFCYDNAPIHDLFDALQSSSHQAYVYVPATSTLPKVAAYFGKNSVKVGDKLTKNTLSVEVLPFLSQAEYDQLLCVCDINFVRGEDSLVRAIWAGKPFIWQPYLQAENTHIKKLNAFLDIFYANFNQKDMLCKAHQCWSADKLPKDILHAYLQDLPTLNSHTLQQSQQLAKQRDLAAKLVSFCNIN